MMQRFKTTRAPAWFARAAVVVALSLTALAACTCGHSAPGGATPGGTGSGAGSAVTGEPRCEAVRAKIEGLYRDEARAAAAAPARVDEAVRDNTAMVLAECVRRVEVASCAARAGTARELEHDCLTPLDDEGSEGDTIKR